MRWTNIFRRSRIEKEMSDELRFHIETCARDLMSREGVSRDEALRRARIEFGAIEKYREEGREAHGLSVLDHLIQDIRYALRILRKNPGFTIAAVCTLAVGIGANTAIFSVVDAVILRPLTYRDAGRLVSIHEKVPPLEAAPINALHFLEWRKSARSFEDMAILYGFKASLTGGTEPERINLMRASPHLFSMLGVQAQLGRTFFDNEDQPGRGSVAVISYGLWRRRFGGDSGIIGRTVKLDGFSYQIIGVLPEEFRFPRISHLYALEMDLAQPDLWIPFVIEPQEIANPLGQFNDICIARLKPGISPTQAASELNVIQAEFPKRAGQNMELKGVVISLQDQIVGRSRRGLELTFVAVGMILLIACVNVTNLLLARTSARNRELAVRTAIGASRSRLVRQMLTEGAILSGLGAICGLLLAVLGIPLIIRLAPADIPRLDEVHLDMRVLVFALALSILTALLIALLPALRSVNSGMQLHTLSGSRTTTGRDTTRDRSVLVSLEIALTAMCLIAGGLLLHSFLKLLSVDPGFSTQSVITVSVTLGRGDNSRWSGDAQRIAFANTALDKIRALPGVISVGLNDALPMSGVSGVSAIYLDGPDVALFERPRASVRTVNSDYFRTMGMTLIAGRLYESSDIGRRSVAVISRSTAERVWPGQDAVGKQFRLRESEPIEVIGVVSDAREVSLEQSPSPHVYLPYWQGSLWAFVSFVVKTTASPTAASSGIRAAIREIDPELPLSDFRTLDEIVSGSVAQRRFQMNLVLLFALAALVLASLGIYGVMSYTVIQRTNEIGIRMALGAARTSVERMVMMNAWRVLGAGLLVGIPLGLAAAQTLRTLLFDITPLDWMTLAGSCATLAAVATLAAYLPARRASRIDPMVALRHE
jgi:putative ABC transport system permease protein